MPEIIQSRRGFVASLGALFIAAPAIVRASSLMPVKAVDAEFDYSGFYSEFPVLDLAGPDAYDAWCEITRKAFLPRLLVQIYKQSPLLFHLHANAQPLS